MVVKISSATTDPPLNNTFSGYDLPEIPPHLLTRHGAQVLPPSGSTRATIYRPEYLLVPPNEENDDDQPQPINLILDQLHVRLVRESGRGFFADLGGQSPRARLVPTRSDDDPVDAALVMQRIRAAVSDPTSGVDQQLAGKYSMEHLMVAGANIGGTPWESHNLPGGGSYSSAGGSGPVPVSLALGPPERRPAYELDRRPVVAVLDTGIAPHPWFGIGERGQEPTDNLIMVLSELQDAVGTATVGSHATVAKLAGSWDDPISAQPLIGQIERATGHGTYIAGIIRQCAPVADILSIRVMQSDGVAYEGDVLQALRVLVSRVNQARDDDDPTKLIDVVSMSLGYYDENDIPTTYTGLLKDEIHNLTSLGVTVVASAGNDASTRPFYPAALAGGADPLILAVGALNPNETKAAFSNEGPWVRWWATGAGLVSTFPIDVRGPQAPDVVVVTLGHGDATRREGMDPDDFHAGFAVWAGTSFAAPQVAALVADGLIAGTVSLTNLSPQASIDRAVAAVDWARTEAGQL